ncbi:MAG: hypothetical protein GEU80_01470 [Dehalococcoidia bacterium]|nr:hypothetical protein [Dehalococcoidia bacterium]
MSMSASRMALRRRARRRSSLNSPRERQRRARLGFAAVIWSGILLASAVGAAVTGGAALFAIDRYNEVAQGVVPPEELLATWSRGGARVYDRDGELLYEFVDELGGLRRPVPLSEISDWMIRATISTEDASFYENNGLNMRGLVRAGMENLTPIEGELLEGSGGSSITQQLAKNVYIPAEERTNRSIDRKVKETVIALELTEKYSKEQILEWYLNSISYGGIYMGIQAAAQGYFGKDANELTLAEAALLAGIPQSPSRYAPPQYADGVSGATTALSPSSGPKLRQLEVLDLMVRHGVISRHEATEAAAVELSFKTNRFAIQAPHFVLNRVANEIRARFGERALFNQGLEVTTTIDMDLQEQAQEILESNIVQYGQPANLHNSALLAIDARNGQIITYVGSRDYFRQDIEGKNDNIMGLNSPGSTLKPFTFMTAFTQGWGTGTGIIDAPYTIVDPATGEDFSPRDPISTYLGPITAASALGNSLNITAVKAIQFAGVDRTIALLKQVGYTSLDNPLGYGPALTVGGVDITLYDQTIAYSVLANNGVMRGQTAVAAPSEPGERKMEPIALLRVVDADGQVLLDNSVPEEQQVIEPAFPYLVTSILSDGRNQCITYGVCNALALPDGYPSAAKTGTSEPFDDDSRDIGETWTMGYTPNLVVGVWSGNSDNSRIHNISSATLSLYAWRQFMLAANEHMQIPPQEFERPEGVVEREVCWPSGRLPSAACPRVNRYKGLFAESVLPTEEDPRPEMYDTWWQRSGNSVRLVLPSNEVARWGGYTQWVRGHFTGSGGESDRDDDDRNRDRDRDRDEDDRDDDEETRDVAEEAPYVALASPSSGATVRGAIAIVGSAVSTDIESVVIQVGRGQSPDDWTTVSRRNSAVGAGILGSWDTTSVDDGTYTVRAVATDGSGRTAQASTVVRIRN